MAEASLAGRTWMQSSSTANRPWRHSSTCTGSSQRIRTNSSTGVTYPCSASAASAARTTRVSTSGFPVIVVSRPFTPPPFQTSAGRAESSILSPR